MKSNRKLFIGSIMAGLLVVAAVVFYFQTRYAPDVKYVPTPQPIVNRMLEAAKVGADDIVYDLGSGDGRIPITAVKDFGAKRAVGVEIDPELIRISNENAQKAGVADRVEFIHGDIFKEDFSEATVLTLYLLPEMNVQLRPKILKMKPGTRVVAHDFGIGKWKPDQTIKLDEDKAIFLWTVPENKTAIMEK